MQVVRLSEGHEEELQTPLFTGPVFRTAVEGDQDGPYRAGAIRFSRGVRNKYHTHSTDQILVITHGSGIVATEDEQFPVSVGDVVICPAGEKHWHGASPGAEMTHVTVVGSNTTTIQLED